MHDAFVVSYGCPPAQWPMPAASPGVETRISHAVVKVRTISPPESDLDTAHAAKWVTSEAGGRLAAK